MCGQFVGHYGASSFSKIFHYALWEVILVGALFLFGLRQCALIATLAKSK
ncbi:MAG: hypothetical protein ACI9SB_001404 [Candidatus Azotimanducaceae bacterium]|jgi:hypothetical protein